MTCLAGSLTGQDNPFDLTPRLEQGDRSAMEEEIPHPTGNPFDVVPPPEDMVRQKPLLIVEPQEEKIGLPNRYRRFVFSFTLFALIFLTFLFSIFRGLLGRVYRSFLNENILNQIFRDKDSVGPIPYWTLYCIYFINMGFFVFLIAHHYEYIPWQEESYFFQLLKCTGIIIALMGAKHIALNVIAYIFPIQKEVRQYSFMIMIFNIVLGVALAPVNLIVAYSTPTTLSSLILVLFTLIGLFYLFRHLRGIMIANKYLVFHKFHFLLYICTVEIAPMMVLLKLILG